MVNNCLVSIGRFFVIIYNAISSVVQPAIQAIRSVGGWFSQSPNPSLPSPVVVHEPIQERPNEVQQVSRAALIPFNPLSHPLHAEYLKIHGARASATSPTFEQWLRMRGS
jgi:hypothetical protein